MPARRKEALDPLDWAEIRGRVETAGHAVAGETAASPERVHQVLEARARALARPAAPTPPGDTLELITFALANEVYALESRYVWALFRLGDLSPLPGAEPPVFGVTAWRGGLLTILDLRPMLNLSAAALNDLSRVIVLGTDRPAFGVLADAARELVRLPASAVRVPPEGLGARREYLRGITGDALLVLEAQRLLHLHA